MNTDVEDTGYLGWAYGILMPHGILYVNNYRKCGEFYVFNKRGDIGNNRSYKCSP